MKVTSTSHGIPCGESALSADAFSVRAWDQTVVAVLCDGAGTDAPAREAAMRAVSSLVDNYEARPRAWSPAQALEHFAHALNSRFYQESMDRHQRVEMVCTLAAAVIEGDRLHGVHAGDSRIALLRAGALRWLTTDEVDSRQKNLLTNALGLAPAITVRVFEEALQDGDTVLLLSDGVWGNLDEQALSHRRSARHLVAAAHEKMTAETRDDASAIVLDVARVGAPRSRTCQELPIPEKLYKGQEVDGYELLRPFQDTDRVWLAEKDGQRVVLKFAPLEARDSPPHLDAFVREVWTVTRLRSALFIRAHEPFGRSAYYYVMEFVNAPNLASVLQARRLSVDSAIGLGHFLCDAAQLLLRHDLAHGDIKPGNVLCVGDYARLSFKMVDLGSAAPLFSVTSRAGTASYLAPERFHEAPVSERTEIFAIGVTLYEALTGTLPYGAIERFQTPAFVQPARASACLNPNIPPWLDAVILRAIARDPHRRYQTYSEMAHDLAHPDRVEPFHEKNLPLLQRDPLSFYRAGFFLLLGLCLWLAFKLITGP